MVKAIKKVQAGRCLFSGLLKRSQQQEQKSGGGKLRNESKVKDRQAVMASFRDECNGRSQKPRESLRPLSGYRFISEWLVWLH